MVSHPSLESLLRNRLERAVRDERAVHGGILRVETPGFAWQGAAGLADPAVGVELLPEDQFQAASITKMLTATTFMTLVEAGLADLDAAIGCYLPASLTDGLHDYQGRTYGAALTPRQLLSHTSGIADFFGDGEPGAGGALPFVAKMREDPDRLWDPRDILAWTRTNLRPHFAPGRGWHYADTGYVLAGLIIEAITGRPLRQAMRERILDPLGMDHSYMLLREPARPSRPGRGPSVAYAGDMPYGTQRSVSADWGGGGLVVTAADLARFMRAFADDRIFRDPGSRRQMLAWTETGEPGVGYGLGVRHFSLADVGMPGFGELWGHTGFLKSFMLHFPELDAVICGTLNQSAAMGVFSRLRPVAALVRVVLRDLRTALR
jgi:CubicO group peptidase (beta-lactamase class C family)